MTTRVAIIGAGVTGLSAAWFLQEHGVDVTVLERDRVAAGASWGNAGWLLAGDSTPLTHPDTLRHGLRGLFDPMSPFVLPKRLDPELYGFLLRFASNCTTHRWTRAMKAFVPLANAALSAYDDLARGGVAAPSRSTAHLAAFTTLAERDAFARWLEQLRSFGLLSDFDVLDAQGATATNPVIAPTIVGGVALRGQRYVDPSVFMPSLAESVAARGGSLRTKADVRGVRHAAEGVDVLVADSPPRIEHFDAVIVATGAWLTHLVRGHGVRVPVRAGRGYSFRARLEVDAVDPVYLPSAHLAATPMRGRLRFAGTMEFRRPDAPLDRRRIRTMVEKARPLLQGVDLDDLEDEWVGPRPVPADGLPIAGPTRTPGVWCIGGHAMEGMVLGPVTARLLAESVASGRVASTLLPFDPCR